MHISNILAPYDSTFAQSITFVLRPLSNLIEAG